jgi:hypothetical protein
MSITHLIYKIMEIQVLLRNAYIFVSEGYLGFVIKCSPSSIVYSRLGEWGDSLPPIFSEAGGKFYIEKEGKRSTNGINFLLKKPPFFKS